jgi:hypothetical protein
MTRSSRLHDMSRKYPLTYPAPAQRRFRARINKAVPRDYYDAAFRSSFMRGPFKKVSKNWASTLFLGALIAATGHSWMVLRSLALVVIAVCLALDAGLWINRKVRSSYWKASAFSLSLSAFCCLAMTIMYFFLASTLQAQQDETFERLTVNHYLVPGEEDDPMHTMFSVTNGSSYEISRQHGITCLTNETVGNGGTSTDKHLTSWVVNGKMFFSGGMHTFDRPPASTTLVPGGDAQTDPCLAVWDYEHGTDCADITLIFWYALENQPGVNREKRFRLVAYKGKTGQFAWYSEPESSPEEYCKAFVKPDHTLSQ